MVSTRGKADYFVGDRRYSGVIVRGERARAVALVVLLPDWRGQSPLASEHADFLASLGCTVLIADLYGDGLTPDSPDQVVPLVQHLLEHRSEGVQALAAAVALLRDEGPRDTPVVCLGYSAGGLVALDYGRSGAAVSGIILCSALLKTAEPGMGTKIAPPVLVVQGTQDQVAPLDVIAEVIAEMDAARNDVRFELHTQTHHAFDNPEAGTDPTARLVYSPRSADRARRRIAAFIAEIATPGNGA